MTSTLAFIGLVILAGLIYLLWDRSDRASEQIALAVAKDIEVMGDVVASSLSPRINADVCIGSGACVAACPEKSVIALVRGQARLINPLGFQVIRYRKDAETLPELVEVPAGAAPAQGAGPTAAQQ